MKEVFKGLKVVELASVLAGPAVGMFFAELGAQVIKVENKTTGGDVTRSWKLAGEDPDHPYSAYYGSVNWGKQSTFLDLNDSNDHTKLKQLIKEADLLICNFKAGDAEKFKLTFEHVRSLNSAIIYAEISGFNKSGRTAYDLVLQAETGFLSMNGKPGKLAKLPVAFIDLFAAHQLKEAILIALLQQQKHKQAFRVQVSLYDAALANQASNYLMAGQVATPQGLLHPNIAPYGETLSCKEGKQIVLAVGTEKQFRKLCSILGLPDLPDDKRFNSNQARLHHREELQKAFDQIRGRFEREELLNQLIRAGVPAGAIRSLDEVLDHQEAVANILTEEKEGRQLRTISSAVFSITS